MKRAMLSSRHLQVMTPALPAGWERRLPVTAFPSIRMAFLPTKDLGSGRIKSGKRVGTAFGTG